jgi:RNA polymerase sigma-70 factor (ECF subfamily)
MTDENLMRAYAAGDYSAFETLYRRHSGRVYVYLSRRMSSAEEADEVFQKAFLKLHQSRRKYNSAYPFTQWLFVIVKTTALDHFRKQNRQVSTAHLEDFWDVFPSDLSQVESTQTLREEKASSVLAVLPPEQKRAIEMRVVEEKSYREIALALQKTEQNVRQLVSRALRKLRVSP